MEKQTKQSSTLRTGLLVLALAIASFGLLAGTLAQHVAGEGAYAGNVRFEFTAFDQNGNTLSEQGQIIDLFETSDLNVQDIVDETKLIAPGTSGVFSITAANSGTVPANVTITFTEENSGGIPVVYTFNGLNYTSVAPVAGTVGGLPISGDIAALSAAVGAQLNSSVSAAGTTVTLPVTWAWAFDANDAQTDSGDTALGTAGADNAATIKLFVSCTAVQIQG